MKIATWNVNSIRARLDRVFAWTERERPDVLCMQETKVPDEDFPVSRFADLGYRVETYGQRGYNGVAILSLKPLTRIERGLPGDGPDAHRRLIAASVGGVGGIRVVNVYVPNGQSPESEKFVFKLEWLARLRDYLKTELEEPEAPLLLLGDFNIAPDDRDVHDPDLWRGRIHFHPSEHRALARIQTLGLHDLFRKHHEEGGFYSWWDYRALAFPRNHGLRIDLMLGTRPVLDRCKSCVLHRDERKGENPSDHVPAVAEIAPKRRPAKKKAAV
ncbi:MAG TPA: exodeoxyribonuclease III [Thermoanaerobaculia bacterium]|nr:exodeoxyribonuclease III [Thermoanaerobaculia bacterium]